MAIIRKKELKQMNETQLKTKLLDLKKELMKFRAQAASGTPPQNPGQIKEIKRTIARILTILNNKKKEVKSKA